MQYVRNMLEKLIAHLSRSIQKRSILLSDKCFLPIPACDGGLNTFTQQQLPRQLLLCEGVSPHPKPTLLGDTICVFPSARLS